MTPAQIAQLGPAFADYRHQFLFCCGYTQTFDRLQVYCRGLLSDLKRKTCEPIALASGTAVRTLHEFLKDHRWSLAQVRDLLQRHVAEVLTAQADEGLGTIGLIDETATKKKGTKTPGVQRQPCGELGKKENCIVTVHLGVARGRYKTLVDADLFLPESWSQDRERCRHAGIPDDLVYRPKWQIALGQIDRARAHGVVLDWVTFDEGYGDKPGFLGGLEDRQVRYVGEVPKSLACWATRPRAGASSHRADNLVRHSPVFTQQRWQRVRLPRQTLGDPVWETKAAQVWLSWAGQPTGRTYGLIWARNVRTGEEKYFVSNAPKRTSRRRLLRVGFQRWNVAHSFRLSKGEIGFRHFEGRSYVALMRHLTLCLVTLTFVAGETSRWRGEKSGGDRGADLLGSGGSVRGVAGAPAGHDAAGVQGRRHKLSPAAESGGAGVAATPAAWLARGVPPTSGTRHRSPPQKKTETTR
jgi:SRSO17 transposase